MTFSCLCYARIIDNMNGENTFDNKNPMPTGMELKPCSLNLGLRVYFTQYRVKMEQNGPKKEFLQINHISL